jgi:hypothetical protein
VKQGVKIAWPNNSAFFWVPEPELAVSELNSAIKESQGQS